MKATEQLEARFRADLKVVQDMERMYRIMRPVLEWQRLVGPAMELTAQIARMYEPIRRIEALARPLFESPAVRMLQALARSLPPVCRVMPDLERIVRFVREARELPKRACEEAVEHLLRSESEGAREALLAFTTSWLGRPRADLPFVLEAIYDDGHYGDRKGGKGWWNAARPLAYLNRVVARLKARERRQEQNRVWVAEETPDAFPAAEPVQFENVQEALRDRGVHLDRDCASLLQLRLARRLSRDDAAANELGWTPKRLAATWRRLNRAIQSLGINLDALWN